MNPSTCPSSRAALRPSRRSQRAPRGSSSNSVVKPRFHDARAMRSWLPNSRPAARLSWRLERPPVLAAIQLDVADVVHAVSEQRRVAQLARVSRRLCVQPPVLLRVVGGDPCDQQALERVRLEPISAARARSSSDTARPRSTSPCQTATRPAAGAPQARRGRPRRRRRPARCSGALAPVAPREPARAGVPEEELRTILQVARRRSFAKNEVVFHRGDPADCFHLIAQGRFASSDRDDGYRRRLGDTATLAIRGPERDLRGSSPASRSARPYGAAGSCRQATAARPARRRRRSRPLPPCNRLRTPRARRRPLLLFGRGGRSSTRSWPAASAGARRCRAALEHELRDRLGLRTDFDLVRAAATRPSGGSLSVGAELGDLLARLQTRAGHRRARPPRSRPTAAPRNRARRGSATAPCSSPRGGGSGRTRAATPSSGAASTTCSKLSSSRSSS